MDLPFQVTAATFVQRPNRFRIEARLCNDEQISAHCPNPGRLGELLIPGATVYLSKADDPKRKTPYTLRFVEHPLTGQLISLDTQLPNKLFEEGLQGSLFPQFACFQSIQKEATSDLTIAIPKTERGTNLRQQREAKTHSRFDFLLTNSDGIRCWIEVKSVSLVEARVALFPDAKTARGTRHLRELIQLKRRGDRAAAVFLVQRPDAVLLRAYADQDLDFAQALTDARSAGVELYAYTCHVMLDEVRIAQEIPVE